MSLRQEALDRKAADAKAAHVNEVQRQEGNTAFITGWLGDKFGVPAIFERFSDLAFLDWHREQFGSSYQVVATKRVRIYSIDDVRIAAAGSAGRYGRLEMWLVGESEDGEYLSDTSIHPPYVTSGEEITTEDRRAQTVTIVAAALADMREHPAQILRDKAASCPACGRGW